MKKLIFSVALLAGMTIVACAEDDGIIRTNYVTCQVCEIPETAPSDVEDQPYEVCVDKDGVAYVDHATTGLQASYYFSLYCANEYEGVDDSIGGSDEPGDPTTECKTCAEYQMMGQTVPASTVCKGTNGNAFLEDMDTGANYEQYIELQEIVTDCQ